MTQETQSHDIFKFDINIDQYEINFICLKPTYDISLNRIHIPDLSGSSRQFYISC